MKTKRPKASAGALNMFAALDVGEGKKCLKESDFDKL